MQIKNYDIAIEPELGEIFALNNILTKYKCIESIDIDSDGCSNFDEKCEFKGGVCSFILCSMHIRKDKKDVIFIRYVEKYLED